MVPIPSAFVDQTIQREGEVGRAWIARLPGLVDRFVSEWGCRIDSEPTHGGVALVVPVTRGDEQAGLRVAFWPFLLVHAHS